MTDEPVIEPQDSPDLDDTERTEDELYDILATGNTIDVLGTDTLTISISVAEVALHVKVPLCEHARADLVSGLAEDKLALTLPPWEQALGTEGDFDEGEFALLGRALAARTRLIGKP